MAIQICRFYVDDKRKNVVTTQYPTLREAKRNLDIIEREWRKSIKHYMEADVEHAIGERSTTCNVGVWVYRTDHSLTIVTTESHVLYRRIVPQRSESK